MAYNSRGIPFSHRRRALIVPSYLQIGMKNCAQPSRFHSSSASMRYTPHDRFPKAYPIRLPLSNSNDDGLLAIYFVLCGVVHPAEK